MYPVSDWSSSLLRTIMDISARATSLADRPRRGRLGHQCSHAPGRPILHLVSSSRRPRQVKAVALGHQTAPHSGRFLSSCLAAVPSSRPASSERAVGRGLSRLAVASPLPCALPLPGHALTGPSTARGLSSSGRHLIDLDALESAPPVENCPGDAGELVGERDRQHVVVQSLLGSFDPRPEPIVLPLLPELD
jgi:hypothetical protein